ncbi:hypothetical protein M9Y10_005731 [Tritrichomonas musculus]|uniref:DDE-1 domain-containing protein n=1 Tax=Tritrichomonas musculus TaxID=1915356 RepID=A0ABR2JCF8_9EUKA
MYCFNAIGQQLDPIIILPSIENLSDELTNKKSKLFVAFCIYFSAKISLYRLQLPEIIASEPTILIVDNHPSRINSFAIEILTQNKIHLLTIPTHTSHILQQFDLTVTKSLKSLMNKSRIDKEINEFSK